MVVVGGPVPMSQLSCLHGVERRAGLGMGPALQLSHCAPPNRTLSGPPFSPLCRRSESRNRVGTQLGTRWVPGPLFHAGTPSSEHSSLGGPRAAQRPGRAQA